jgi:hypothetical protein
MVAVEVGINECYESAAGEHGDGGILVIGYELRTAAFTGRDCYWAAFQADRVPPPQPPWAAKAT